MFKRARNLASRPWWCGAPEKLAFRRTSIRKIVTDNVVVCALAHEASTCEAGSRRGR
jgi:hypothetical protein